MTGTTLKAAMRQETSVFGRQRLPSGLIRTIAKMLALGADVAEGHGAGEGRSGEGCKGRRLSIPDPSTPLHCMGRSKIMVPLFYTSKSTAICMARQGSAAATHPFAAPPHRRRALRVPDQSEGAAAAALSRVPDQSESQPVRVPLTV